MGIKYYNRYPSPQYGFGAGISKGLTDTMEQAMKEKETAQTVDFEFRKQGLVPAAEAQSMGIDVTNPNLKRFKYKDTEWIEPITPYEQSKRDYEADKRAREIETAEYEKTLRPIKEKKLKMEAEATPIMLWNPATLKYDTIEGGAKTPKVINPPSALPQQKFDAAQAEKEAVNKAKSDMFREAAESALKTVDAVSSGINFFGANRRIPAFPGGKKADWNAQINKLTSEKILETMNKMKSASKTGATGFGQLNKNELEVLVNASTVLANKDISEELAAETLADMKAALNKIVERESQDAQPSQPMPTQNIEIPSNITTTSEALKYLMGQGIPQDEAIRIIQSQ